MAFCAVDFPETVCRKVRGGLEELRDGLRGSGGGELDLSDPSTSLSEIFEPEEATCQGEVGASLDGVGLVIVGNISGIGCRW